MRILSIGLVRAIDDSCNNACDTCGGSGAAEGSKPTTCPQCHGHGQLRYQQGFFTVARTCAQCRGAGSIITKPCLTCRGAGRVQKERKLRRCCMNTRCGWGGVARTSRDPPQEPHYRDAVEGPSHV